ncbi:MAG: hypothetical protein V1784_06500 [bacterium]
MTALREEPRGSFVGGGKMVWLILLGLAIGAPAGWAGGLVGRPAFCIGSHGTAMTLEFSTMRYAFETTGVQEEGKAETQRGLLRATFGLAPGLDADLALGTANLSFPGGPEGYSTFRSDWALAWGGGCRFGYPFQGEPWQLQLSASYIGFRAEAETANMQKAIFSRYTWQEFTPALTAGYRFGQVTPYVGVMQTFLFGTRETTVEFLGVVRPSLGGKQSYADASGKAQGLLGVDWRLPDGYYVTARGCASGQGQWGFLLGLAQALK